MKNFITSYIHVLLLPIAVIANLHDNEPCPGQCDYTLDTAFNSSMCNFETEGQYYAYSVFDYRYVYFELNSDQEYTFNCKEVWPSCPYCKQTFALSRDAPECQKTNATFDINGDAIIGRNIRSCFCGFGYQGVLGSATHEHQCEACPAGKFKDRRFFDEDAPDYLQLNQDNFGVACQDCAAGTFADSERSTTCTLCPTGKYAPNNGSVSGAQCRDCAVGTSSTSGAAQCTACPAATFIEPSTGVSNENCWAVCSDGERAFVGDDIRVGSRMPSAEGDFQLQCPASTPVVTRLESEFEEFFKRRKWTLWCAELNGGSIVHDVCRWTPASVDTAGSETSSEYQCKPNEIMAGIESTYSESQRAFGMKCCTLKMHPNNATVLDVNFPAVLEWSTLAQDFDMGHAQVQAQINGSYPKGVFWQMKYTDLDVGSSDWQFSFHVRQICFKCVEPGGVGYDCSSCPLSTYPNMTKVDPELDPDSDGSCLPCPPETFSFETIKSDLGCVSLCQSGTLARLGETNISGWLNWNTSQPMPDRGEFEYVCPNEYPVISQIESQLFLTQTPAEGDRAWNIHCARVNGESTSQGHCRWVNRNVSRDDTLTCSSSCSCSLLNADVGGVIDDGSGSRWYEHNSHCEWKIVSYIGRPVSIFFTDFATEQDRDHLKLYSCLDEICNSPTLITSLSGSWTASGLQTKNQFSSTTGIMKIVFTTDTETNDDGWVALFTSGLQNDNLPHFFQQRPCAADEVMSGFHGSALLNGANVDSVLPVYYRLYSVYCCTLHMMNDSSTFTHSSVLRAEEDFISANFTVKPLSPGVEVNRSFFSSFSSDGILNSADRSFQFRSTYACFECRAGYKFDSHINACIACERGKFKILADNSQSCEACDTGKYSNQLAATASDVCIPCPSGTYSDVNGLDSLEKCTQCEAGKYSSSESATTSDACLACPVGKFSANEGADSFNNCTFCTAEPGYYCDLASSNSSGVPCPIGHKCKGGSDGKSICPSGTFAHVGSSTCSMCPAGSYYNGYGAENCIQCPVNETSPFYSTSFSDCFSFEETLKVCPQGFWYNENDNTCKPCTHIGNIDEYEIQWQRAIRYTHFDTPPTDFGSYIDKLEREDFFLTFYYSPNRFSIHPDRLARHCGLTHDAVVCPHGLVYDPSSPSQCKLPLPTANATRTDCRRGTYFNTTDQDCHRCPRNLTTLHDGSSSVAACLFCDPAYYLNASGEDEACVPCHTEDTCRTTQAFGGAEAHRMPSCSIPCGPEHMREENQSTYKCFFSRCMHQVRAQDIHPCVFTENGTVQTNASESRCHPYFVPLAPDWVEVAKSHHSSFDSERAIFPGSGYLPYENDYGVDSEYISTGNERVQYARQQMQYVDWYYLLFTTNTVRKELGDNFIWPHIQANMEVPIDGVAKDSEEVVFDKILHDAGLLFLKDAQALHETAVAMDNGSLSWPKLRPYKGILRWTDLVRHAYEFYQKNYVEPWVENQCSNLQENNHNEMYHCHIKAFAWKPEPIQWRLSMGITEVACGTSCQGGIHSECGRDENDIKEQLFNQTHGALTHHCNLSRVTFDDLQQCLQDIHIDLPGIEEEIQELDSIDSCLWPKWVQNFTSEHGWVENISAICENNTEACNNGNWPWLCYNTCKTHLEGQCPEIKLTRDTSMDKYAVLNRTEVSNSYLSGESYMEGEKQFLEQTQQNICNLTQSDRQAMLREHAPEFPGGAFFLYLADLRDRIEEYWNQHRYTCNVAFDDNVTHTYPCIFEETTGGDYEISFVDRVDAENYTLTVTFRAEHGVQQNITLVEKVDPDTTRPFCQIANPAEFNMVRESVDFL